MGKRWGSFTRYTDAREAHPLRKQSEICWVFYCCVTRRGSLPIRQRFLTSGGGISLRLPSVVRAKIRGMLCPDCLTSAFLAARCLKVVIFVWGIVWAMRRERSTGCKSPSDCRSPKVASLQTGPLLSQTEKLTK